MPDLVVPDCRLVVIVTHPDRDAILTVPAPDGAPGRYLPSTIVSSEATIRDWIASVDALTGRRTVLLRHDTIAVADHDHATLVVLEVEPLVPRTDLGTWHDIETLADELTDAPIRAAIDRWLARRRSGRPSARLPWSEPGWFARASAWMLETLAAAGRTPIGAPVQHYQWSITSVLRCSTDTGDTFMKATSSIFPQETPVTALLATRTPSMTPTVIATERSEGWLLMADHGGRSLGGEPEATWAAGLSTHARIQRAWSVDVAAIRAAGGPDRSLAGLATGAVEVGDDDARMARLDANQRVAYRKAVPRLVEACGHLEALGIDPGLVHGDLHPDNVALRDDRYVVFDWSDVAIGHPFIDLVPYVFRSEDVAIRRACRDAYLAEWADVVEPARLQEAAALALPIGCLYQVMGYIGILDALGPDDIDDMADADLDWIDRTVRVLDQGIEARGPD